MTPAAPLTSALDSLVQLGAKALADFLLRQELMCQYSRQDPVPTDVVELLQGRHRDSDDNEVVRLPTLLTPGTSHRFDLLQRVEPTTKP